MSSRWRVSAIRRRSPLASAPGGRHPAWWSARRQGAAPRAPPRPAPRSAPRAPPCRGSAAATGSAGSGPVGQESGPAGGHRASSSGRKAAAVKRLNRVWKLATARAGIRLDGHHQRFRSAAAAPARRCDAGKAGERGCRWTRRRWAGSSPPGPSITGVTAEPMLAPSTRAKAAAGGTTPLVASDMVSSTMATEEWVAQAARAPISTLASGTVDDAAEQQAEGFGASLELFEQVQQLVQRQQHQPEADEHAAEIVGAARRVAAEHHHADQDEARARWR